MKKLLTALFLILGITLISGCSLIEQKPIDNSAINEQITVIQQQMNEVSSKIETLKSENKDLKKESEEIKKANEELKKESEEIKKQNTELKQNTNKQENNIVGEKNGTKVYKDDKINFELSYLDTRNLQIENQTLIWDGIGKTLNFSKKGYEISIIAYPQRRECGSSGQNPDTNRQKININGKTMFRQKQAYDLAGMGPGMTNNPVYIDFVDQGGEGCLMLDDKFFTFGYILPVSSDDFKNGKYSKEILAEMDKIVSSIKW